jgi:energy-coupling factor transporter ATP-binding protein EcfA2
MYVTEIEITNLRCFEGTHKLSLDRGDGTYAGWTVFVGRNGSGKSTLLRAIALAAVGQRAGQSLTVAPGWVAKDRGQGQALVVVEPGAGDHYGADAALRLLALGDATIAGGLQWRAGRQFVIIDTVAKARPRPGDPDGSRINAVEALEATALLERGPWAPEPNGWFIVGYGAHRRLGAAHPDIQSRSEADPVFARVINLFSESATLSESVDWLKDVHLRALERKDGATELKADVLRLLGDGLLPDGSVVKDIDSDGLWVVRDGVRLNLDQVSDGYRTVAALVLDLARRLHATYGSLALTTHPDGHVVCDHEGVVLIDEVDAHLHVSWQQQIGFWLTSRFPKLQFLVTTHSPFICQAASPRGIVRLPAPGEVRKMEHLDPRTFRAVVNGSADDAVLTELFGLEHAHSPRAEELRDQVATLEALILDGKATPDQRSRFEALRAQLPDGLGDEADQSVRALLARINAR